MAELGFIFAFACAIALVIFLIAVGMPSEYAFVDAFDFTVLAVSLVGTGIACSVWGGVACAIGGSIFSGATFMTYVGAGFLTTGGIEGLALLKAFIFTPLTIAVMYIMGKLARGGG